MSKYHHSESNIGKRVHNRSSATKAYEMTFAAAHRTQWAQKVFNKSNMQFLWHRMKLWLRWHIDARRRLRRHYIYYNAILPQGAHDQINFILFSVDTIDCGWWRIFHIPIYSSRICRDTLFHIHDIHKHKVMPLTYIYLCMCACVELRCFKNGKMALLLCRFFVFHSIWLTTFRKLFCQEKFNRFFRFCSGAHTLLYIHTAVCGEKKHAECL